ncbi:ClbS/DfsB family four-helix bundle protein [Yokenella regensburgei]|uniref:ClbS/DfsB family four-helix bundle protein n=1 Tax=Yokenella regensburgei TaxID=158877 RepID=UPI003F1681CA
MSVPQSRAALLEAMEKSAAALRKKLDRIPAQVAFTPCLEGHAAGTTISPASLVSYLIGWGEQVLYWHHQEASGSEIDFPATGFKWNELGKLAQKYYADYAHIQAWAALLARLEETQRQLRHLVEAFSDEALYHQPWYGKWTRGRMIQFNSVSPCKNASARLNPLLKKLASSPPDYFLADCSAR